MKNFKIRSKLIVLVATLLTFMGIISVLSIYMLGRVNTLTSELANVWVPGVSLANNVNTSTSDFRTQEYKHILAQTPSEMASVEKELEELKADIFQTIADYEPLCVDDNDRKAIADIKSSWEAYLVSHQAIVSASQSGDSNLARDLMVSESLTLFNDLDLKCRDIVSLNKTGALNIGNQAANMYSMAVIIIIISVAAALIAAIVLAVFIVRAITNPVKEIGIAAADLSQGKLDTEITYESKDEIGHLAKDMRTTMQVLSSIFTDLQNLQETMADGNFNIDTSCEELYIGAFQPMLSSMRKMTCALSNTMGQINQSSDQVSSGSDQVSSGAQALSQGATEQASSIEELAATINEISAQINTNAQSAQEGSQLAEAAGTKIEEGNRQMQEMIAAMKEISDKSSQIGKIIKTIEDIAFQTNILALNAAVEAARAGSAGKGFAVVADEVRNLASKSAEASKSTAALIEGSIHAVEKGTKLADETAQTLSEVVESARQVVTVVDSISQASNEQASAISQVTQGIDQISSVVQTNSATAEESAAASEELSGQAQMLKSLVAQFKLKETGDSGSNLKPMTQAPLDEYTKTQLNLITDKY